MTTHTAELRQAGAPAGLAATARSVFHWLVHTGDNRAATVLRLSIALVMFPHGAQKVLGWWGGYGFAGTMDALTGYFGVPVLVAVLVILIEFLGPLALAVGFLSRVAAAGVALIMLGAVATTHAQFGFFMNWTGQQAGEGFEYHLLMLAITAVVMIRGSGALSIDRRLAGVTS